MVACLVLCAVVPRKWDLEVMQVGNALSTFACRGGKSGGIPPKEDIPVHRFIVDKF